MVRPAARGLADAPGLDWSHLLFGCDATQGIVSIDADASGRARVWRRTGERTEVSTHRFPTWFLATSLDLLAHLPARRITAAALRAAHGDLQSLAPAATGLGVVELNPPGAAPAAADDVYRYLVLVDDPAEVETALVEMANKRDGGEAQTLTDLRGLVLVRPPIEQFLILSGRTYFKGMVFDDLRRLQFDLETTGLDEDRDRIFMVSMRDTTGWQECLDTNSSSEARLIERFVELIRAHDPDVLENHNIFGFDLPFLVKRAARLGVRLGLGRDGSEPTLETDLFDAGERDEPFLRWRVAGREVVDTQHAVRRFGFDAPDMRRHGLKEAARYFGFARPDREYVPGVDVWPTFRTDPERIRRYAADDVDEVDGLSRRLLRMPFGLATMLPRAYERIAADSSAESVWEPLLLRAYLHEAQAIAAPMPRLQRLAQGPPARLFLTGVVGDSARAVVRPLLPSVVADHAIAAANDDLGLVPRMVSQLLEHSGGAGTDDTRDGAGARLLASTSYAYLASQGLFADPDAAAAAGQIAQQSVDRVLADLRARGCRVIEVDGEQVLVGVPATWGQSVADEVTAAAAAYLPPRVELVFDGEYAAVYARAPRSAILLGRDGRVTLVGSTFRPGRLERFGETFMQRAAPHVLRGEAVAVREVFLATVHELRMAAIALTDLCVQMTLHKSPPQYRRAGTREEPYEVLLAAGIRSWRVGQRIRYFRARGGEPRLHVEGDRLTSAEADPEYYVQRLTNVYCQQFVRAFRRPDFLTVFRVPTGPGPYADDPATIAALRAIRPVVDPA